MARNRYTLCQEELMLSSGCTNSINIYVATGANQLITCPHALGGYANVQISYFAYQNDGLKAFFSANIIAANENAKILVTPPEIGEYQAEERYFKVSLLGRDTMISTSVDDEKLARILMMYDYANFSDEGYVIKRYGIEGDTFEWAGEPLNSSVKWLKQDDPNGYGFFSGCYYTQYYIDICYTDG